MGTIDDDLVAHMALPIRSALQEALDHFNEKAEEGGIDTERRKQFLASAVAHAVATDGGDDMIREILRTRTFQGFLDDPP